MNKMPAFASNSVEDNERRLVALTRCRREVILTMRVALGTKRRELLARTIADLTKVVFAAGMASQFFREFGLTIRALVGIGLVAGVSFALWVQPEAKNDD